MSVWGKLSHVASGLRRACLPTRRRRRRHQGDGYSESLESRRLLSASPVLEDVAILEQTESGLRMGGIAAWGAESQQGVEIYFDFGGDGSCESSLRMEGGGGRFSHSVPTEGVSGTVDLYVRAEFADMSLGQQTTRWKVVTVVLPAADAGSGQGVDPGSSTGGSDGVGDRMVRPGRHGIDNEPQPSPRHPGLRDVGWNPRLRRFRDSIRQREKPIGGDDASVGRQSGRNTRLVVPVLRDRGPITGDADTPVKQDKPVDRDVNRPYFSGLEVKRMGIDAICCRGRVQCVNNNKATIQLGGAVGPRTLNADAMGNFFGMFRWVDRSFSFVTLVVVDCHGRTSDMRIVEFS